MKNKRRFVNYWAKMNSIRKTEQKRIFGIPHLSIWNTEEEDVEEKITRDTLVRETLNQYLKWKPPIDSFSEDGLASLPSDKRDILLANIDQIFHEDNTFQKQIKTVVSLIYDPSKSHLVHQIRYRYWI